MSNYITVVHFFPALCQSFVRPILYYILWFLANEQLFFKTKFAKYPLCHLLLHSEMLFVRLNLIHGL